jgi:DNA-binding GntR family transcriptional regulator
MPIPPAIQQDDWQAPAREVVLANLRAWIVEGTLSPGEIIKDTEIAQAFSVSRTPVREALLQLRAEGLVEMKPKGWTQVKLLDLAQVEHLLPVVVDLECLAARLAAGRPERDLGAARQAQRDLVALVERNGRPVAPERAQELLQANDRFHAAILDVAGNTFLTGALQPLKSLLRRYERIYFGQATPIDDASLRQHEELLDAIARGDGERAATVMAENFANAPLARQAAGPISSAAADSGDGD